MTDSDEAREIPRDAIETRRLSIAFARASLAIRRGDRARNACWMAPRSAASRGLDYLLRLRKPIESLRFAKAIGSRRFLSPRPSRSLRLSRCRLVLRQVRFCGGDARFVRAMRC